MRNGKMFVSNSLLFTLALTALLFTCPEAKAQEPYLGEIRAFAFNFPPRGWAQCDGQLLPISQYSALFSLLGTQYGGDGRTTFGLPDLRGRAPIHEGNGPGLSNRIIGSKGGEETVTLTTSQMPSHTHAPLLQVTDAEGTEASPAGHIPAHDPREKQFSNTFSNQTLHAQAIIEQTRGGNQEHENMPPYLTINYCICLEGVYPSRN
ncbi:phage tail protein [Pontiella sp.]|uniref:phage tail protein n=1 Tax=Pontiella sp. TaxID=2837462 RepID=UPI0035692138